jgi:hypothetical protein
MSGYVIPQNKFKLNLISLRMKKNKTFSARKVIIRLSNVERRNTTNPRQCFTVTVLDDDKKVLYRKDVVVHCSFEESVSDDGLQCVVVKLIRNIEELVPQNTGERGNFDRFIERLEEELYRYAERTKPVLTLF